jgi:DNA replication and repair protein RecF
LVFRGNFQLRPKFWMLKSLTISNFRNFDRIKTELDSHVNVLVGSNGHGKTNFLEAVYYLSLLRSFRTNQISDLRQWKKDFFRLECECTQSGMPSRHLSVTYGNERRLQVNGTNIYRTSDFINQFICVTFIPQDKDLIRGSEVLRRRFMDISLSQMSTGYLRNLQSYTEALRARNAMLKDRVKYTDSTIKAYDHVLVKSGVAVEMERREFMEKLNSSLFEKSSLLFSPDLILSVRYLSGIGSLLQVSYDDAEQMEEKFRMALRKNYERDCRKGFTHCGPHRAEMTCLLNLHSLLHFGSEGECRMASLAIKFAFLDVLRQTLNSDDITLLVDDVTGELDTTRQDNFYRELLSGGQIIYAGTFLPEAFRGKGRVFNVKSGMIASL